MSALGVASTLGAQEVVEQAAQEAAKSENGGLLETAAGLDSDNLEAPLRALALVTVFGVVPSIVLLTTCFPRILIVLSFLRRALGTQDLPPNMIVFGFSLLLTGVVMMPVWTEVYREAYVPLVETKELTPEKAYSRAELPVKRFLLTHTLRADLALMIDISSPDSSATSGVSPTVTAELGETASEIDRPLEELSLFTILPAFVLSELKLAFQMGFLLFLPFLLIDLVVSAVLVSMGMIMLPPTMVSLPLKILVFVLVDGWSLVVGQLLLGLTATGG
jgi:flagellar biosynthetic protein FliP